MLREPQTERRIFQRVQLTGPNKTKLIENPSRRGGAACCGASSAATACTNHAVNCSNLCNSAFAYPNKIRLQFTTAEKYKELNVYLVSSGV